MSRASRRLIVLALALALGGAACTAPTYDFADIEGSDAQTRYPAAVAEARDGLMRAAAMALVLFTAWLAVDVARRGTERHRQGAAFLTAALIVGVLVVSAFVAQTSGPLPQGRPYQVAVTAAWYLGLAALPIGATWVLWAFEHPPAERGETTWGIFIIVLGLVSTVMVLGGTIRLLTGS